MIERIRAALRRDQVRKEPQLKKNPLSELFDEAATRFRELDRFSTLEKPGEVFKQLDGLILGMYELASEQPDLSEYDAAHFVLPTGGVVKMNPDDPEARFVQQMLGGQRVIRETVLGDILTQAVQEYQKLNYLTSLKSKYDLAEKLLVQSLVRLGIIAYKLDFPESDKLERETEIRVPTGRIFITKYKPEANFLVKHLGGKEIPTQLTWVTPNNP